ncbi:hypothetical protein CRUP_031877 [Coryphaenoides rupestris]|nr:hypothetical protein CRUP_031877 [Coryphaenoides rupestris]
MPVRKKDTSRALGLLEEYCSRLRKPEEDELRTAIQRVMVIFKSNLFEALLGVVTDHDRKRFLMDCVTAFIEECTYLPKCPNSSSFVLNGPE